MRIDQRKVTEMQIVIDISEEYYNEIKEHENFIRRSKNPWKIAVLNGTVLPEKHGDLIDRDELKKYAGWYNLATDKSIHAVLTKEIDWVKPVIERTKEGENE